MCKYFVSETGDTIAPPNKFQRFLVSSMDLRRTKKVTFNYDKVTAVKCLGECQIKLHQKKQRKAIRGSVSEESKVLS